MAVTNRAVWLVDSDDPTLVGEAVRGLIDELVGDADRSMAVEDHRGDEVDLAAVADACRTPPFLSDRRVVVVRNIGRFATEDLGPILAYLDEPLDTTALVLAAGGGRLAPKLVAAAKATGHITGTAVSGRDAKGWVRDRIKASPLRLDGAAVALVEAHLGEDVSRLGALLDVLVAAYGAGTRLGPEQLEPYLGDAGSVAPWDFTDAIDTGRTEVALDLLHRLLGAGERHPLVVASILTRHVQSMLRVDGDDIVTEAQAAAAMGIAKGRSTYPAKKALTSARRLGTAGIAEAIGLVADAEVALKGGNEWQPELILEVLVARLCRLARRRRAPVSFGVVDYLVAGGAALVAGGINGIAGGGTLVSFPALIAIGVPALAANVTNTVAPGARVPLGQCRGARRPAPAEGAGPPAGALRRDRGAGRVAAAGDHAGEGLPRRSALVGAGGLRPAPGPGPRPGRGWCRARGVPRRQGWWLPGRPPPVRHCAPRSWWRRSTGGSSAPGWASCSWPSSGCCAPTAWSGSTQSSRQCRSSSTWWPQPASRSPVTSGGSWSRSWRWPPLAGGNLGSRLARRVNPTLLRRLVVLFGVAIAINFFVD